jgi:hypothetical protein
MSLFLCLEQCLALLEVGDFTVLPNFFSGFGNSDDGGEGVGGGRGKMSKWVEEEEEEGELLEN